MYHLIREEFRSHSRGTGVILGEEGVWGCVAVVLEGGSEGEGAT